MGHALYFQPGVQICTKGSPQGNFSDAGVIFGFDTTLFLKSTVIVSGFHSDDRWKITRQCRCSCSSVSSEAHQMLRGWHRS